MANERTFLAWSRTALALVVGGLAIAQLLPPFRQCAVGAVRHRHPADPARRGDVGAQLLRVEGQPACAPAGITAAPLAAAEGPGRHDHGDRADRRCRRPVLPGRRRDEHAGPRPPARRACGRHRGRRSACWPASGPTWPGPAARSPSSHSGIAILKFRPVVGIPLLAFSGVVWLIGRASPALDQPGDRLQADAASSRWPCACSRWSRSCWRSSGVARLACGRKLTQIACSAR